MARKVTHMSLEGGVLFFEDGTEVSGVSVDMIKALPDLLEACEIALIALGDEPHEDRGNCSEECTACILEKVISKAKGKQ